MTLICCVRGPLITMATAWGVVAQGGHVAKTLPEWEECDSGRIPL
jgi:hypothetical protein